MCGGFLCGAIIKHLKQKYLLELPHRYPFALLLCCISALEMCIVTVLFKKHVDEIGSFWFAFILELTLLITVVVIYILKKNEHEYRFNSKQLFIIFFIGLATAAGSVINTYAYNYFSPSIISIAAKFAILPPFLFAIIILKQKLSLQKVIGLLVILLAIYLSL